MRVTDRDLAGWPSCGLARTTESIAFDRGDMINSVGRLWPAATDAPLHGSRCAGLPKRMGDSSVHQVPSRVLFRKACDSLQQHSSLIIDRDKYKATRKSRNPPAGSWFGVSPADVCSLSRKHSWDACLRPRSPSNNGFSWTVLDNKFAAWRLCISSFLQSLRAS